MVRPGYRWRRPAPECESTVRSAALTVASDSRQRGARSIRCPAVTSPNIGRPSPEIERFLAESGAPTPFVVVDLAHVERRYDDLAAALPDTELCYAVKANPSIEVVTRLAARGASFDVASPGEIDLVLALGVDPSRVSYG